MCNEKRVKFLDPAVVEATIAEVAELAARGGVDAALIGGVAMMVYGSDRLTKDVDVALDMYLSGVEQVEELTFGGEVARTPRGHTVDLVVRADEYQPLYLEAVDHAVDVGLPLKVVRPDYLLALKMAAARDKDVSDVKTLVVLGVVDVRSARKIVKEHLGEYAARELDDLVDEAHWQKSRAR